jgi:uncharacterized protein
MLRLRFPAAALILTLASANPLLAQTAAPVVAQPAFTAGHLAAARDVVIGTGIASSFESIFPEFRQRMEQSVGVTRPDIQKDLKDAIEGIKPEAAKRIEEMVMASARVFAGEMTEVELKEIAAFYNTPVGKRFNAARPVAIDRIFNILQPWSIKTSDDLYSFLRVEMKKKGHDI